jgi:predicted nucleic acid-binding protein
LREERESCKAIIELVTTKQIRLILPAYSVGEPYEASVRRAKRRVELHTQLLQEIKELSRSEPYIESLKESQKITNLLIRSVEEEKSRLDKTLSDILNYAEIIPIAADIIRAAVTLQGTHNLSPQDSIVYASILAHLKSQTDQPKCFLTKNSKDFVTPEIIDELQSYDCKLLTKFEDGLGYIHQNI